MSNLAKAPLTWTEIPGATWYLLEHSHDAGVTWIPAPAVEGRNHTILYVEPGTVSFRVAPPGIYDSPPTETWETLGPYVLTEEEIVPDEPVGVNVSVSIETLRVAWNPVPLAATYRVEVWTESTPSSGVFDTLVLTGNTEDIIFVWTSVDVYGAGGPFPRIEVRVYAISSSGAESSPGLEQNLATLADLNQHGWGTGDGDVVGPSSVADGSLAVFSGPTGKLIREWTLAAMWASAAALTNKTIDAALNGILNLSTTNFNATTIDTDGNLAANSDTRLATQKAVKTYADQLIAAADAMVFKGVIDASANPNYPTADKGHTYRISVAGKIGGASGPNVEIGDLILALADGLASGNHATVGSSWSIAQTNVDGAVIGPASVTDDLPVIFDGTTGKLIKQKTYAAFKTLLVLVKGDVGLGSVDNTADSAKPVSTAQQTALDLKANLASPVFTGNPTAPTPAAGDSDTSVATTAFVQGERLKSKVVNTTYDLSTASGTQDITGFGFDPTSVSIAYGKNTVPGMGTGFASSTGPSQGTTSTDYSGGTNCFTSTTAAIILFDNAGAVGQRGIVSFIADGIRITWTKFGSPTGTLSMTMAGMK